MFRKQKLGSYGFALIFIPVIVIAFLVATTAGLYVLKNNARTANLSKTKDMAFITASPVDLAQINNLSKFRSCSGHDYSGTNVDGIKETMRSMKHYAAPDSSLGDSKDKIKVFAPFDGTVSGVGKSKGRGVGLSLKPTVVGGWVFEFGHVEPLTSITKGAAVKAGDLIGYANVTGGAGGFDLQLYYPAIINTSLSGLDSFMNHLSIDVVSKFAEYGFTKDALVVSQAGRDTAPCKTDGKKDNNDAVFVSDLKSDIVVTSKPLSAVQTPQASPTAKSDSTGTPSDTTAPSAVSSECAADVPAAQRPPGCQ